MDTLAPLSSEFKVGTGARADVSAVNGGYAFAWIEVGPTFTTHQSYIVNMAEFKADGSALLPKTQLDSAYASFSAPAIDRLADGSVVVAWTVKPDERFGYTTPTVYSSTIDLNGVRSNATLAQLNVYSGSPLSVPDLAPGHAGGYTLVVQERVNRVEAVFNDDIFAGTYTNASAVVAPRQIVNDATPLMVEASPSIVRLSDNRQIVTWTNVTTGQARAHFLDAAGVALGSDVVLGAADTDRVAVAALPGGGFVATWTSTSNNQDVVARIYDASGVAQTAVFTVNGATTGAQNDASVTTLSDGTFAIAWTRCLWHPGRYLGHLDPPASLQRHRHPTGRRNACQLRNPGGPDGQRARRR
jgi:hypothetical protein